MPDPLQPPPAPDLVGVPVELNEVIPHGVIALGVNDAGQLVRVFARHEIEVEALIEGQTNLKVVRFPYPHPPTAPPVPILLADLLAEGPKPWPGLTADPGA